MARYLIRHPGKQSDDILIEDPTLALDFHGNWAVFSDKEGIYLALPANEAQIERVDEAQDHEPAPQKE